MFHLMSAQFTWGLYFWTSLTRSWVVYPLAWWLSSSNVGITKHLGYQSALSEAPSVPGLFKFQACLQGWEIYLRITFQFSILEKEKTQTQNHLGRMCVLPANTELSCCQGGKNASTFPSLSTRRAPIGTCWGGGGQRVSITGIAISLTNYSISLSHLCVCVCPLFFNFPFFKKN